MDFKLTAERRMLSDSLTKYLTDKYGIEHRNNVAYNPPYYDPNKWQELAGLNHRACNKAREL